MWRFPGIKSGINWCRNNLTKHLFLEHYDLLKQLVGSTARVMIYPKLIKGVKRHG